MTRRGTIEGSIGIVAVVLILKLLQSASCWAMEQPQIEGLVESNPLVLQLHAPDHDRKVASVMPVSHPNSQFVRLHFSNISDSSTVDYRVVVRDQDDAVVVEYPKIVFNRTSEFWTAVVFGESAKVYVLGDAAPTGLSFTIDKNAYQSDQVVVTQSLVQNKLEPLSRVSDNAVLQVARSVAKLSFFVGNAPASCTGFMISDNLLMTNEHCINSASSCRGAFAIFGYEDDASGQTKVGEQIPCEQVIRTDPTLDFAVLRLSGSPGAKWGHLALSSDETSANQELYIVQHPGGSPKEISRIGCMVAQTPVPGRDAAKMTDFADLCDSMGGSSGSPVVAKGSSSVIGLHHLGFTDPPWNHVNRAVEMKLISLELKRAGVL